MFPDDCMFDIVRYKNGFKIVCRFPDGFTIQYIICGKQVFATWKL